MTKKVIYALGFFDGVHLGHQALLTECCRLAKENGCKTAALTFDLPPASVLKRQPADMLNTVSDRIALLKQYGMERVTIWQTNEKTLATSWEDFLAELLAQGAAGFVCGEDFRFGHKGLGSAETLAAFCKERGLPCAIVPDQLLDGIRISSTHIRGLLTEGKVAEASRFLGHPHIFSGKVVEGRQLGRTIGIPTANLAFPEGMLLPKKGVYACKVRFDGAEFMAVTNVGNRPTVNGEAVTVEPFLLDFDGDLYGKEISVAFYKFLRPEQKFASLADLQKEIQKNAHETRIFFEKSL